MSLPHPIPARNRLPNRRACQTISFERNGSHYQMTVGYFPDGRVGEIFLNADRSDSLLDVLAGDAAIAVMQFPKDTLARLLAHDRDVCGVFCNERVLQFDPVGKPQDQSLGFGGSSLVEAASLGCGLPLIRTTVFDRLKRPWFYHRDEEYGEDYNFIRDCKEAGIGARADIDLSFEVSHVGEFAIGWKRSDVGSAPVLDVR